MVYHDLASVDFCYYFIISYFSYFFMSFLFLSYFFYFFIIFIIYVEKYIAEERKENMKMKLKNKQAPKILPWWKHDCPDCLAIQGKAAPVGC